MKKRMAIRIRFGDGAERTMTFITGKMRFNQPQTLTQAIQIIVVEYWCSMCAESHKNYCFQGQILVVSDEERNSRRVNCADCGMAHKNLVKISNLINRCFTFVSFPIDFYTLDTIYHDIHKVWDGTNRCIIILLSKIHHGNSLYQNCASCQVFSFIQQQQKILYIGSNMCEHQKWRTQKSMDSVQ